jgi:hypothetical protein
MASAGGHVPASASAWLNASNSLPSFAAKVARSGRETLEFSPGHDSPEWGTLMPSETILAAASYEKSEDAEAAVADLGKAGFGQGKHVVEQGIMGGVLYGGVIGGLVGLLFPPAGIVVAAGPILGAVASALSTAGVVAVAGGALSGLTSALVQAGMPHDVATQFGEHIHKGDTLLVVHTTSEQAQLARRTLDAHNPRASTDTPQQTGRSAPASAAS